MPNLRLIDIRGTKVTEPGVIRLKTDFPSLQVVCDFPEWTVDVSSLPSEWLIDREFCFQEDIKKPPPVASSSRDDAPEPSRHEQIEIIDVGPGMVRLRRIIDGPLLFLAPRLPPQEPPPRNLEPEQPHIPPPQDIPLLENAEPPRSPESSSSSRSESSPPLDKLPDSSA